MPRDIPIAPADGERILNSDHILELREVPTSLVVLGAGAVGIEFASVYASFGTKVTLIEMLPRILPIEDEDCSAELQRALRKRGIDVMAGTKMSSVERTETGVRLHLEGGKKDVVEAELLLSAVGRRPVTENIGLEALGVELERGYVKVNPLMQTNVPTIYAIGDVVNTPWLAHVASAEGILAVEHMAGLPVKPLNYDHVPVVHLLRPGGGQRRPDRGQGPRAGLRRRGRQVPLLGARQGADPGQDGRLREDRARRRSTTRSSASTSSASTPPS